MNEILTSTKMTGYHLEHMLDIGEVKVMVKRDGVYDEAFTHYVIDVISSAQAGEDGFVELYENGEIVRGMVRFIPKGTVATPLTNDHLDLHKSAPPCDPHAARPNVLAAAQEKVDWKPHQSINDLVDAMPSLRQSLVLDPLDIMSAPVVDEAVFTDPREIAARKRIAKGLTSRPWKAGDEHDTMTGTYVEPAPIVEPDETEREVATPIEDEISQESLDAALKRRQAQSEWPHTTTHTFRAAAAQNQKAVQDALRGVGVEIRGGEHRMHRIGCKGRAQRMKRAEKSALLSMMYGGTPKFAALTALEREGHPARTIHRDAVIAANNAMDYARQQLGKSGTGRPNIQKVPSHGFSGIDFGTYEAFQAIFHVARPTTDHSTPGGFASQVTKTVVNRGSDYGTPSDNHQTTADMWSAFLSRRLGQTIRITPEDVCLLNSLQKHARLASGTKDDSLLDIAGYVENVAMLKTGQRNTRK